MPVRYKLILDSIDEEGRHYCPRSEKYTGVDSLVARIHSGYTLRGQVFRRTIWRGGSRPVHVYYFELQRGNETIKMPVVSNPRVSQIIEQYHLEIVGETSPQHA